jgi:hypothetical protein
MGQQYPPMTPPTTPPTEPTPPIPPGHAGTLPGAIDPPEPRWPAVVAAVAIGLLYLALPQSLAVGPRWLFPALIVVLTAWSLVAHRMGRPWTNHAVGFLSSGVLTAFVVFSLTLLLLAMVRKTEEPLTMVRSAAALWASNVLTFALWYWRLDAGGPNGRDLRVGHECGAFLFPQMTNDALSHPDGPDGPPWSPQFVDYLFLAFNTSTAFSPTDAPVLSRWAKVLTMVQSTISLAVVVLLAARSVNIL